MERSEYNAIAQQIIDRIGSVVERDGVEYRISFDPDSATVTFVFETETYSVSNQQAGYSILSRYYNAYQQYMISGKVPSADSVEEPGAPGPGRGWPTMWVRTSFVHGKIYSPLNDDGRNPENLGDVTVLGIADGSLVVSMDGIQKTIAYAQYSDGGIGEQCEIAPGYWIYSDYSH